MEAVRQRDRGSATESFLIGGDAMETKSLRINLTALDAKVDQYHAATKTQLEDQTKVVMEIPSELVAMRGASNQGAKTLEPAVTKALNRVKAIMEGGSASAGTEVTIGPTLPHKSQPTYESILVETPAYPQGYG
ncbi:hypothetical protein QQ045_003271 [Rhodiola kirilowii]